MPAPRSSRRGCIPLNFENFTLGYLVHCATGWKVELGVEHPNQPDFVGQRADRVVDDIRAFWREQAAALPAMGPGFTGPRMKALWTSHQALLVYACLTGVATEETALVCRAFKQLQTKDDGLERAAQRMAMTLTLMERLRVSLAAPDA